MEVFSSWLGNHDYSDTVFGREWMRFHTLLGLRRRYYSRQDLDWKGIPSLATPVGISEGFMKRAVPVFTHS